MAYFPYAFPKTLLATAGFAAAGIKGENLVAATVGVMNLATNTSVDLTAAAAAYTDLPLVRISQGSLHTTDNLGLHGGYKESDKSQPIDPRHVHRFYKHVGHPAQADIVEVGMCDIAGTLVCGQSYWLRLELSGSPVLRFMNHNMYRIFDAFTGCCPLDPAASQAVAPWTVLEQWAQKIASDNQFSKFVNAKLVYTWTNAGAQTAVVNLTSTSTDASIAAARPAGFLAGGSTANQVKLRLTGAYVDTKFGQCSFDINDYNEMAPLKISASGVDETHNPCVNPSFCVVNTQLAIQATGNGEKILREKILSDRYMQEDFQTDVRMREVLDQHSLDGGFIDRSKNDYCLYYILFSVPRKSNPSGTLDNDQYLLCVVANAPNENFENWFQDYLEGGGSPVRLETIAPA